MSADRIDPHRVRFSRRSAAFSFRDGMNTIATLAAALQAGRVDLEHFPPIRLVERKGQLFTLDHRRLEAFRRADVAIPFRMATPAEAARESWKFTTRNDGLSLEIKDEPNP